MNAMDAWAREAMNSWPKAWAIDTIPSCTDDRPYASYEVELQLPVSLAGFGPLSNGVPIAVGGGGASERELPPPLGKRCILVEEESTRPLRRKA